MLVRLITAVGILCGMAALYWLVPVQLMWLPIVLIGAVAFAEFLQMLGFSLITIVVACLLLVGLGYVADEVWVQVMSFYVAPLGWGFALATMLGAIQQGSANTIIPGLARPLKVILAFVLFIPAVVGAIFLWGKGGDYLAYALVLVAVCDVFAYGGGRLWGRRIIAPTVSPKKTWEGFYTSIFGLLGVAWLVGWLGWSQVPVGLVSIWAVIAGVATVGDFFESSIKRAVGVKDSGSLLPGHGGFWDRLDAHVFALPFLAGTAKLFDLGLSCLV